MFTSEMPTTSLRSIVKIIVIFCKDKKFLFFCIYSKHRSKGLKKMSKYIETLICNNSRTDFRYLLVNERDKKFGLTVDSVGFQTIPLNTFYPPMKHPKSHFFRPDKGRILSSYHIVYISKGKGVFSSESTSKTDITKGQVILLFPGQWHTYNPLKESGWDEYYIGFKGEIINDIVAHGFISPENQVLDVGASGDLVNLYSTAIRIAKEDKGGSQQYLAGIALNILGTVLSLTQNKKFDSQDSSQKIELAKILMIEHINDNINMKRVAESLGISYTVFRKEFKEFTGYAPLQFFHELKVERAKKLLTETSKPLKEIAHELGFGTYDYFLSFFEKRTGQSPSNYRK